MAVRRRKIKRFVIDVNTFITIFINKEAEWLLQYVIQNKIEVFVDGHLMGELLRVLDYPRIKKRLPLDKRIYANFVLSISTPIVATEFHVNSPDKEDNYLYDIALTAHAKLLVTGEKALLNWAQSPVETINLTSFKELF
jgi:putative PIN family toxin of toxin-antitoxin system